MFRNTLAHTFKWLMILLLLASCSACQKKSKTQTDNEITINNNKILQTYIRIDSHPTEGYALSVLSDELFDTVGPVFEAEGSYANGPAWAGVVEYIMAENGIRGLQLDDEAAGMVVYSRDKILLNKLRSLIIATASNPKKLRLLILDARAKGFAPGDL
jgi:hypothetical protein